MFTCVFFSSDNDECSKGTDNCLQMCINTIGSFNCKCYKGYVQDGAECNGEYYMKHTHMFTQRNIICMYKITHTFLII